MKKRQGLQGKSILTNNTVSTGREVGSSLVWESREKVRNFLQLGFLTGKLLVPAIVQDGQNGYVAFLTSARLPLLS